jgi:pyrroline-5-carboxylate reductase
MGFALAKAISGRFPDSRIHVCDLRSERLELFQRELPRVQAAAGPSEVAEAAEVVFLAVKPQDIQAVLEGIRDTDRLLISIAAGVAIGRIEGLCPRARVVRVMPNTPCLVGAMAAGYAFGSGIRPEDREAVEQLLGAAGYAAEVEERLLDAEVTRNLALQTFYGTAKLLADTGMEPQQLVEMVSSPKGTTVAGRQILEASAYAEVIGQTIRAATERSKELGR